MRIAIAALAATTLSVGLCSAQTSHPAGNAPASAESSGRTNIEAHQENVQPTPQGQSGPLNTTSGGAPAASPQGQTPPGMQAAPEGSRETIVDKTAK